MELIITEWIADQHSCLLKNWYQFCIFLLKELATLYQGLVTKNVSGEHLPRLAPRPDVSGYVPPGLVTRNVRVKALLDC